MKNYSRYSLMFVFVGSSMQASQLQLQKSSSSHGAEQSAPEAEQSSLAEPSRYIADPSQISRPCSPSRSIASQVMASCKIEQEEEKASSSMSLAQSVAVEQRAIKYPLSNEIKQKVEAVTGQEEIFRAATLKKIEGECLSAAVYFEQNRSLIKERLRKCAPQLDECLLKKMENDEIKAVLEEIAKNRLDYYDLNNVVFENEGEKYYFLETAVSCARIEALYMTDSECPRPSFNFVRFVKENSVLDSRTKYAGLFIERAHNAFINIRDQLSLLVVDQPKKLKELIEEECGRQADAIHEGLKLQYNDLACLFEEDCRHYVDVTTEAIRVECDPFLRPYVMRYEFFCDVEEERKQEEVKERERKERERKAQESKVRDLEIQRGELARKTMLEIRNAQEAKARKLEAERLQEFAEQKAQEAKRQAKKDKKCVIQ